MDKDDVPGYQHDAIYWFIKLNNLTKDNFHKSVSSISMRYKLADLAIELIEMELEIDK